MTASWRGKNVLITAGPTREPLDPVRYLTNASSGRMGYALAVAARKRGARVTLVSGPTALTPPRGVAFVPVVTARQMLRACLARAARADLFIAAAAVADWRPARTSRRKIKKNGASRFFTLRLSPNPDILRAVARRRRGGRPVLAGFALETERLLDNARRKMREKGLDLIVANPPAALDGDATRAWILPARGTPVPFRGSKSALADRILSCAEPYGSPRRA